MTSTLKPGDRVVFAYQRDRPGTVIAVHNVFVWVQLDNREVPVTFNAHDVRAWKGKP